ncbi:MAG TPA: glycosyltransferase family 1 protein [Mucilaginibacter sp.]|jgi:glycosyltransferase involved in cell wall biosynthesis|nr:glycosyltransferase family 1 protein [Mucilaginibacter sp.]
MTKKPLTVGVDVRVLKVAKTGIKTYIEELCREFKTLEQNDVHFHFLDTAFSVYNGSNTLLKWIGHFRFQLWKQLILPLKAWSKKCDIVFCVDDCVPYIHLGYKTIPSIHDAFCFESPEDYGRLWLQMYKNTAVPGAKRSPLIITATSYGKKQIAHFMDIPADKLVVVHDGPKRVNYEKNTTNPGEVLNKFKITPGNYILHVGAMYRRKNLVALAKAFVELKRTGYPSLKLVLAGSPLMSKVENDPELISALIEEAGLKDDVIFTGYMTDHELEHLYTNALMYVFPSLNEGFGLPVLEAFTHNLPVLVSNNTCLPEVGGDAVLTFDPFDINDMALKIKRVLDDADLRKEMISKGQKRLEFFSWRSTALQIIDVFKRAA